jgi:hypothetical protein
VNSKSTWGPREGAVQVWRNPCSRRRSSLSMVWSCVGAGLGILAAVAMGGCSLAYATAQGHSVLIAYRIGLCHTKVSHAQRHQAGFRSVARYGCRRSSSC